MHTLAEAAKAVKRDKSTLLRAVRRGRLSATRDADGIWRIDESELRRVYPAAADTPGQAPGDAPGIAPPDTPDAPGNTAPYTTGTTGEMRQVLARLGDAQDQIAYLRTKLDRMEEKLDRAMDDLTAERAKVTALLTDQRAASTTAPPPAPAAAPAPTVPPRRWWRWRHG